MKAFTTGPFTGRHITIIMVAFFAVVIAVNLLMARYATSTFGGVVVENSYVASQKFNGWLDSAERTRNLGWKIDAARDAAGRVTLATAGVPAGATVSAVARHPLGRVPDVPLTFEQAGAAAFASTATLPEGRWVVRLKVAAGPDVWRGERALP